MIKQRKIKYWFEYWKYLARMGRGDGMDSIKDSDKDRFDLN